MSTPARKDISDPAGIMAAAHGVIGTGSISLEISMLRKEKRKWKKDDIAERTTMR